MCYTLSMLLFSKFKAEAAFHSYYIATIEHKPLMHIYEMVAWTESLCHGCLE